MTLIVALPYLLFKIITVLGGQIKASIEMWPTDQILFCPLYPKFNNKNYQIRAANLGNTGTYLTKVFNAWL